MFGVGQRWLRVLFMIALGSALHAQERNAVPDVRGKEARTADALIKDAGFVTKFYLGKAAATREQALTVREQKPAPGTRLPKGSQVAVTIYALAKAPANSRSADNGRAPSPSRWREIQDHEVSGTAVAATDMQHGAGAGRLEVRRIWNPSATASSPFGRWWADPNVVLLTGIGNREMTLWRGGQKITAATARDARFQTPDGATVARSGTMWKWTTRHGAELMFSESGQLSTVRLAGGGTVNYSYDAQGRLLRIDAGEENSLHYHYDGPNEHVSRIDGPEELTSMYSYDEQGRLTSVTNSRNVRFRYRYDDGAAAIRVQDSFGGAVQVASSAQFDSEPSTSARRPPNSDRLKDIWGSQPVYKRNQQGQIVESLDRGVTTRYRYDEAGRLAEIQNPIGKWVRRHDTFGRVVSVQGPQRTDRYTYNKFDEVTRTESSGGEWSQVSYDEHGRPTEWDDSSGSFAGAAYGDANDMTLVRRSPSWGVKLEYDNHLLHRAEFSSGRSFECEYDSKRRLISRKWSSGEQQRYQYNADGRLAERRVNDVASGYEYDEDGLLTRMTDPIFGVRTIDYSDRDNRRISLTWGDFGTWSLEVNEWMQPVRLRRPSGQTTHFEYDERALPFEVTTPSQRTWNYEHDDAGRLTRVFAPGRATVDLTRTAKGHISRVSRSGVTYRDYVHGPEGRVRLETTPLGMAAAYTYDAVGRLKEVVEPAGRVVYSYSKFGLVARVKAARYEVQQEFHDDGSLARRTYDPADLHLQLPHDDQGRPAGIGLDDVAVRYSYGENGELNSIELPGDRTIDIIRMPADKRVVFGFDTSGTVAVDFDQLGRVHSIAAAGANRDMLFLEQYQFDDAGNLARQQSLEGTLHQFEYDLDDRLVSVTADEKQTRYKYNADDDLESVALDNESRWQLDNAGRPRMRDLEIVYDWDEAGNLTMVQSLETDCENQFDAAGRLTTRTLANLEWHCEYLPNGDRLWQEGPAGRIWYVYLESGLAGFKDEQNVTWLLVSVPGTDWPLAICGSNGTTYFLVADRLGSIRRVIDTSGQVVARSDYGAFGELIDADGVAPVNMYAGMICDEHGLYYARQRYYDPQLCRFISLDSRIGNSRLPASHNGFAYAANNPYRFRDPGGTTPHYATEALLRALYSEARQGVHDLFGSVFLDPQLAAAHTSGTPDELRPRRDLVAETSLASVGGSTATPPREFLPESRVVPSATPPRVKPPAKHPGGPPILSGLSEVHWPDPVALPARRGVRTGRGRRPTKAAVDFVHIDEWPIHPVIWGPPLPRSVQAFPSRLPTFSPTRLPASSAAARTALDSALAPASAGGDFRDILTQVRRIKQMADSALPDDVAGYRDDAFDQLEVDVKQLKKQIDNARRSLEAGQFQHALELARKAEERICGIVANGYRAADAPRLQQEADDLLKKARSAHRAADEANRKALATRRGAKELHDRLRGQMDRVRRPLADLQNLADARQRSAASQQRFDDQWDRTWSNIGTYAQANAAGTDPLQFGGNTMFGVVNRGIAYRQRAYREIDSALGANTIGKILQVRKLQDVVPNNAATILNDARQTLQDAAGVLEQLADDSGDAQRERDEVLAKHSEAGRLLFDAQKCRGKIFSNPANAPLAGNIMTPALMRVINPLAFRLRPRQPNSLTPNHPLTPATPPAGPKKPIKMVQVPDLTGLSSGTAVIKLRKAGLIPSFRPPKKATDSDQPFSVSEQHPPASARVPHGTKVQVTIFGDVPTKVANRPATPRPRLRQEKPNPTEAAKKPPKRSMKKESKPTRPTVDYSGTYRWSNGPYVAFSTRFTWQQKGADEAAVTFHMDGRVAPFLMGHGLPKNVAAIVKRSGNSYVMVGDPLGTACSAAVTKFEKSQGNPRQFTYRTKISFTPAGKSLVVKIDAVSTDPGATGTFSGKATRL